jgi:hypothetical protein
MGLSLACVVSRGSLVLGRELLPMRLVIGLVCHDRAGRTREKLLPPVEHFPRRRDSWASKQRRERFALRAKGMLACGSKTERQGASRRLVVMQLDAERRNLDSAGKRAGLVGEVDEKKDQRMAWARFEGDRVP